MEPYPDRQMYNSWTEEEKRALRATLQLPICQFVYECSVRACAQASQTPCLEYEKKCIEQLQSLRVDETVCREKLVILRAQESEVYHPVSKILYVRTKQGYLPVCLVQERDLQLLYRANYPLITRPPKAELLQTTGRIVDLSCVSKEDMMEYWSWSEAERDYFLTLYRLYECQAMLEQSTKACIEAGKTPIMEEEQACIDRLKTHLSLCAQPIDGKETQRRLQLTERIEYGGAYVMKSLKVCVQTTSGPIPCGIIGVRNQCILTDAGYPIRFVKHEKCLQ